MYSPPPGKKSRLLVAFGTARFGPTTLSLQHYSHTCRDGYLPIDLAGETQDLRRPHLPKFRLLLIEVQEHF